MYLRFIESYLHKLFKFLNSKEDLIATYDLIDYKKYKSRGDSKDSINLIGIVVQGPVVDRTTRLCIDFLNLLFPNSKIVLSTWKDENVEFFKLPEYSNTKLLVNEKPTITGFSNINLQIVSTKSGVDYLASQGCTHVLKVRSDVIITNPNSLDYLLHLHELGNSGMVFSSFNTFLNRLYSVSDQLMFGTVKQLNTFWSAELVSDYSLFELAESYLFKNYLIKLGFTPENTLDAYLQAILNHAVIADHEILGQIWNKGTFTSLSMRWRDYGDDTKLKQIRAQDWILMRDNLNKFKADKKIVIYRPIN